MKLSISNIAWENDKDQEMYQYISKMGFDAIEIAPTRIFSEYPYEKLEEAREFAKKLEEKYKLKISSMQSIWYGREEKIFSSKDERENLIMYTKQAINFAHAVGCKNIVFGCPKNRNIKEKEDYNTAIDFFRTIGKYAEEHNVVFAIEPNPVIYGTNFINTTEEAFNIVKEIDCKAIKVNIDLGTIIENRENLEILQGNFSKINHIHISEPNLEIIQKRIIHRELAKILQDNQYENYVSIEMKKCENITQIKEVMKYIRGIFR